MNCTNCSWHICANWFIVLSVIIEKCSWGTDNGYIARPFFWLVAVFVITQQLSARKKRYMEYEFKEKKQKEKLGVCELQFKLEWKPDQPIFTESTQYVVHIFQWLCRGQRRRGQKEDRKTKLASYQPQMLLLILKWKAQSCWN